VLQKTDLVLPCRLLLVLTRTYRTLDNSPGPFGPGTSHAYEIFVLSLSPDALLLTLPGNSRVLFARQPDGRFVNSTEPGLRGAAITPSGSTRLLTFKDGEAWTFDGNGRLVAQRDRNGNTLTIARDGQGRVTALTEPAGRQFTFSYSGTGLQITQVTDPLGRTVRYGYDVAGRLATVTDPAGGVTTYTYDGAGRLTSITDPRGITFLRNEYDSAGRVSRQVQADGGVWTFAYTLTGGLVTETRVTDPRGLTTAYRFNTSGYLMAQTDALGQRITFEREVGTNVLLSTTDPYGRVVRFGYDATGNPISVTDPAETVWRFSYDPAFNQLTSVTDPLGSVTQFGYDGVGNLTSITDPLGASTQIGYNAVGQPVSTTDPLGNVTRFAYDPVGNLSGITDPLGHVSTRTYDGASRLLTQTDPHGKASTFAYDALNRLTQIVDPLGGVTHFTHDGNGNLLTVTDALSHTLTHEYDAMDRLSRRIDPLGQAETFTYDGNGNVIGMADRTGQATAFAYDALNRRMQASHADGSVTKFTYDAAGRLVLADDSADPHRPITLSYDGLDRLVAETTSLGTVAYQYDALGRRTQMRVNDGSPVAYTYDAASRLRTVTQAPLNPVTIDYDPLGRRARLTLPNLVSTEYQYDAASRLTALLYRNAIGLLGDLTYTYDAAGNRSGVGGSFARTLLPDPVANATYDPANRQRTFGDKTMSYDANGNLTSLTDPSGTTTFTWDAQNRLTRTSIGPSALTFAYDALGRRATRIANGSTTAFHYGVTDVVRDLQLGSDLSYLRGLGPDQTLVQGTALSHLTDATNSTLAAVDSAGAITHAYSYEPFGRTLATGPLPGTRYQYTGRERELGDLYYYRARYYHAGLMRFLQPDPLGLLAGINPYVYVENSPTNFLDPSGLRTYVVHGIWSDPSNFEDFRESLREIEPNVILFPWGGRLFGDTIPSTRAASSSLLNRILQDLAANPLKPGEKLNLIGHSAGGIIVNNVANILKARGIKVNNLIFMGSPQLNGVINRLPPAGVPLTNFVGMFDPLARTNAWTGARLVSVYTGLDPYTAHTSYTKNPIVIRTIQQLIK
jgi:RHS repeat-associated protein